MSPTHQDLSNDTTFSQIKSRVPVPLRHIHRKLFQKLSKHPPPPCIFICTYNAKMTTEGILDIVLDKEGHGVTEAPAQEEDYGTTATTTLTRRRGGPARHPQQDSASGV